MDTYIIYQPATVKAHDELEFCKNFIDLNNGKIAKIYQDDISRTQLKLLVSEIENNMLGPIHHFLSFSQNNIPNEHNIQNIIHELFLRRNIHITYLQQNISTSNPCGMLSVLSKYYGNLYDQGHLNYFEFIGSVSNQVTKIYNTASEKYYCECTLCGWRGMRFKPAFYKDGFLDNIICENCDSWGRHRRAWGLLHDGGFLKNGIKLLDTAPMKLLSQKIQQCNVSYTSIDIETDRKPSIQGDLTKIPFKEKTFDLVLSMQVLEHIMDDKKALQDLISVTKDNGTLIISVPYNKKLGSVTREYGAPNWDEFGHVREYGMDVVERFTNEGLHIEEFVWGEEKNKLALLQLGIDPSEKEVFFICKKNFALLGNNSSKKNDTGLSLTNNIDKNVQMPRSSETKILMTLIIPTFNRAETVEKTLRAYNNQTVSPDSFEIQIVDDGSTDNTKDLILRLQHEVNYTLHYHYQNNQGPGEARNWGIKNTSTEYVFITGDDIIPEPNLIWEHLKTHISDPRDNMVVLGHVDWPPEIPMNPLMYFLTELTGTQFGFHEIQDPENAGFGFFYTSNISLKTSFLKNKDLFNRKFIHAAYEDIELGYRLQNQGMKMKYNKNALGYHDHAMTYDSVCKRQHKCGQMAVVLDQLHPELNRKAGRPPLTYDETQHRQLESSIKELNKQLINTNFEELIQQKHSSLPDELTTRLNEIFTLAFELHFRLGSQDYLKGIQSPTPNVDKEDMFHDMSVKPQDEHYSKIVTPSQNSTFCMSPKKELTKERIYEAIVGSSQPIPDYNLLAFIDKNPSSSEYTNTILLNLFLDQKITIHSIPTKRETFVLWKTNNKFLFFNTKNCYEIPSSKLSDNEILQCCDCEIGGERNHILPPQKADKQYDYFSNELLGLKSFELLPAILKFVFGNISLSEGSLGKFTTAHLKDLMVHQGIHETSVASYHNLVNMFCCSNGLTNDFTSSMISIFTPPKRKEVKESLLGRMDKKQIDHIIFNLKEKGYYQFDISLPEDFCNPLIDLAKQAPCNLIGDFQGVKKGVIYDENNILAPKYQIPEPIVVNHPMAQKLFLDNGILEISKTYLNTDPYLDITSMWWTTVFSNNPSHTAAQLFHFDMDRIHWCKWFLYLTDVTENSGPLVFIEGSHRRGKYPQALLNKGYARLTDSEILQYYPQEKFKYFTGKKGTLVVVNTRGFHKGLPPTEDPRLIYQLEFSNSLFGNHINQEHKINNFNEINTGDYNCDIHKLLRRFR